MTNDVVTIDDLNSLDKVINTIRDILTIMVPTILILFSQRILYIEYRFPLLGSHYQCRYSRRRKKRKNKIKSIISWACTYSRHRVPNGQEPITYLKHRLLNYSSNRYQLPAKYII